MLARPSPAYASRKVHPAQPFSIRQRRRMTTSDAVAHPLRHRRYSSCRRLTGHGFASQRACPLRTACVRSPSSCTAGGRCKRTRSRPACCARRSICPLRSATSASSARVRASSSSPARGRTGWPRSRRRRLERPQGVTARLVSTTEVLAVGRFLFETNTRIYTREGERERE